MIQPLKCRPDTTQKQDRWWSNSHSGCGLRPDEDFPLAGKRAAEVYRILSWHCDTGHHSLLLCFLYCLCGGFWQISKPSNTNQYFVCQTRGPKLHSAHTVSVFVSYLRQEEGREEISWSGQWAGQTRQAKLRLDPGTDGLLPSVMMEESRVRRAATLWPEPINFTTNTFKK